MNPFNQYSLSVMGIMSEIIGAFFLTLEAFGPKWVDNTIGKFVQFSVWSKKKAIRTLVLALIVVLPFVLASMSKILLSLLLPISIFILLFTTIVDDAGRIKKWATVSVNTKKIGPWGFIMLLIGNLLQLISTIIQIK